MLIPVNKEIYLFMSTHKIVHAPVYSSKSMPPSDRLLEAAQLAANGHITETPFGWSVSDPNGEHLVVWVEPFFVCGCKSENCPHTLAVTIYDRAAKTAVQASRRQVRLDLVTSEWWPLAFMRVPTSSRN